MPHPEGPNKEKNNIERAILRFTPECIPGQVGTLNVYINGHSVYSSVPDCGAPTALEFLPEILRAGENQLMFKTDEGNYLIDLIKITSELKKSFQPVFYFDVDEDEFDAIKDEDVDVFLRMTFADAGEIKEGKVNINGYETGIYQKERIFDRNQLPMIMDANHTHSLPSVFFHFFLPF